jgi:Flp pilus assembly pilin Flp
MTRQPGVLVPSSKVGEDAVIRLWLLLQDRIDRVAQSVNRVEGQGLAEYALILALIAIVAIVALLFLGGQVSKILSNVGKSV